MLDLEKILLPVAMDRQKIIEDYIKTYIAVRADWFLKNPNRLRRIVLEEKRGEDGTITYSIIIKRGRIKNIIN